MYNKKGQVAMEFLMTYGWAILAAMVIIGLLGFYYFSSDILSPKAGVVSPPFYLNAYNVRTTGIQLELKNNGGETLNVTSIYIENCATDTTYQTIEAGGQEDWTVSCTLTENNRFDGRVTITYTKAGSNVQLISTGSIKDTVVA